MASQPSTESGDRPSDLRDAAPTLPMEGQDTTRGVPGSPPVKTGTPRPEIPGFDIVGELGRGAMGVVYEARQTNLNRTVAIKLVSSTDEGMVQRFEMEALALGRVQDDGIIRIFDVGRFQGRPFLVMEVVRGGTLAQALAGNLADPRDAALVIRQMAKSLAAAHDAGILHRDLKPGNTMLVNAPGPPDDLGRVRLDNIRTKLADFGLAKEIDAALSSGLTQTGAVMGTPGYMAPEQALGCNRSLTPATDIHALGAILYEMLTGHPPFRGESPLETIRMVVDKDPLPPRKVRVGIPFDLETICLKCLQKSPARRYQTARELVQDLDAFLEHRTILARRPPVWERAGKWCLRNPLRAASIGFVAIAAILSMGIWGYLNGLREKSDNDKLVELQENLGFERVWANDVTKATVWFAAALEHERRPARIPLSRLRIGAMMDAFPWIRSYVVHTQAVKGADWSPSGRYYLSFGDDRLIKVNDPTLGARPTRAESRVQLVGDDPDLGIVTAKFLSDDLILILDESEVLYAWDWEKDPNPRRVRAQVSALAVDGKTSRWAVGLGAEGRIALGTLDDWARVSSSPDLGAVATPLGSKIDELAFIGPRPGLLLRQEHRFRRWSADGKLHDYLGFEGHPTCMAVTEDGSLVSVGTHLGEVRVWPVEAQQPRPGNMGHREKVLCLAFSHDGKLLATGSMDQRVSVRDTSTGYLKYQVTHEGDVTCLAFSRDPALLYTGSEDNTIRVWHAETGRTAGSQLVYNATLRTVIVHPDGRLLLGGSDDNTCCLWDTKLKNRALFQPMAGLDQFVLGRGRHGAMILMRDKNQVALADASSLERTVGGKTGRFLDLDGQPWPGAIVTLPIRAKAATICPGRGVCVLQADGSVTVWDEGGQALETILEPDPDRAKALAIHASPRGRFLVLEWPGPGHHKSLKIFTNRGQELKWASLARVRCWAISPDDSHFALGEGRGGLILSRLGGEGSEQPREAVARRDGAHAGGISALAFSPDGEWVATGGEDMRIHLWKTTDATPAAWKWREAPHHAALVGAIGFDPTGSRVLSCGEDNTLRVWKASDGEALGDPMLHDSSVLDFRVWSGDHHHRKLDLAATVTTEGAMYLWNLEHGQLLGPMTVPVGTSIRGLGFLETPGADPVAMFGCSLGSVNLIRVQPAPAWATPRQLRHFAEYHPAFGLNATGTALLAISGYQIPPLMDEVLNDFQSEFPPLPPLFSSKGDSR